MIPGVGSKAESGGAPAVKLRQRMRHLWSPPKVLILPVATGVFGVSARSSDARSPLACESAVREAMAWFEAAVLRYSARLVQQQADGPHRDDRRRV